MNRQRNWRAQEQRGIGVVGTGAAGNRGWMSAASLVRCWLFHMPPTTLFSSLQRYPEETTTGIPKCSRSGSRTVWQRYCRFSATFRSSALARSSVLSMPCALAVAERVNSFKEKCWVSW